MSTVQRQLLLDVLLEHLPPDDGAVDVALRIDADAFGAAVLDGRRFDVFDEGTSPCRPWRCRCGSPSSYPQIVRAGVAHDSESAT